MPVRRRQTPKLKRIVPTPNEMVEDSRVQTRSRRTQEAPKEEKPAMSVEDQAKNVPVAVEKSTILRRSTRINKAVPKQEEKIEEEKPKSAVQAEELTDTQQRKGSRLKRKSETSELKIEAKVRKGDKKVLGRPKKHPEDPEKRNNKKPIEVEETDKTSKAEDLEVVSVPDSKEAKKDMGYRRRSLRNRKNEDSITEKSSAEGSGRNKAEETKEDVRVPKKKRTKVAVRKAEVEEMEGDEVDVEEMHVDAHEDVKEAEEESVENEKKIEENVEEEEVRVVEEAGERMADRSEECSHERMSLGSDDADEQPKADFVSVSGSVSDEDPEISLSEIELNSEEAAVITERIYEPRAIYQVTEGQCVFGKVEMSANMRKLLLVDYEYVKNRGMIVRIPCGNSITHILGLLLKDKDAKVMCDMRKDVMRELCTGMMVMFNDVVIDLLLSDGERRRFTKVVVKTTALKQAECGASLAYGVSPATVYGGVFMLRFLVMLNKYVERLNVIVSSRCTAILEKFTNALVAMIEKYPTLVVSEYGNADA